MLLAVPNISEGRSATAIAAIAAAFAPARLLDVHSDRDHNRSVFTLAARQGELACALAAGARATLARLDLAGHRGVHPHVGVIDVAPVVYRCPEQRGAAFAEALTAAALIGEEAGIPVFLYGELATRPERAERAFLRAGGPERLGRRIASGELTPDFGPAALDPRVGAVLVAARPPLVAFNVDLAGADLDTARSIAAGLRESAGGFPGVRAIGLYLPERGRAQVSMNIHDHRAAPLSQVVAAIAARAEVAQAELVGLAPAAALEGFPSAVAIRGFDPQRHLIENALGSPRG
ncbi:MAG: glutamate formimidoyltransferase [Thermoleophilaceae bacterium]